MQGSLYSHQPGYTRLEMEEDEVQTSGLFVPAAVILVIHRLQFFHL